MFCPHLRTNLYIEPKTYTYYLKSPSDNQESVFQFQPQAKTLRLEGNTERGSELRQLTRWA